MDGRRVKRGRSGLRPITRSFASNQVGQAAEQEDLSGRPYFSAAPVPQLAPSSSLYVPRLIPLQSSGAAQSTPRSRVEGGARDHLKRSYRSFSEELIVPTGAHKEVSNGFHVNPGQTPRRMAFQLKTKHFEPLLLPSRKSFTKDLRQRRK